ncbi:MAG: hypothetical protein HKN93_10065 [Acidimicrobiia bacterium]|nr:hypothetical protein [Acidimicrobiia bacterium]
MIVFPAIPDGEPVVVSASTYTTYRKCPEQAVGRLRGEYSADTTVGFVGGLAHRVFARHLKQGPIAKEDFDQACREEIGTAMNPKVGSLGLKPSSLKPIIAQVGDLYDRFQKVALSGCRDVEVTLEATPAEGVVIRGIVDAVFDGDDGGVVLRDWKTGQVGAVADQLAFYGMLWTLVHGEPPEGLDAFSVKTGETYLERPTRAALQATADDVAQFVTIARQSFADGTALKTAGPWCRYCPLLENCSEGRAAVTVNG